MKKWLIVGPDGKTPRAIVGLVPPVCVEAARIEYARVMAAKLLVAGGLSLDEADAAQVVLWEGEKKDAG